MTLNYDHVQEAYRLLSLFKDETVWLSQREQAQLSKIQEELIAQLQQPLTVLIQQKEPGEKE